eukprot:602102-Pleurochrysis_carterae.AAC.3
MDWHGRALLTEALSGRAASRLSDAEASGQRRHYSAFGCRGCCEVSRSGIDETDILYPYERYELMNMNLHMDTSKHHQTHMIN